MSLITSIRPKMKWIILFRSECDGHIWLKARIRIKNDSLDAVKKMFCLSKAKSKICLLCSAVRDYPFHTTRAVHSLLIYMVPWMVHWYSIYPIFVHSARGGIDFVSTLAGTEKLVALVTWPFIMKLCGHFGRITQIDLNLVAEKRATVTRIALFIINGEGFPLLLCCVYALKSLVACHALPFTMHIGYIYYTVRSLAVLQLPHNHHHHHHPPPAILPMQLYTIWPPFHHDPSTFNLISFRIGLHYYRSLLLPCTPHSDRFALDSGETLLGSQPVPRAQSICKCCLKTESPRFSTLSHTLRSL